MRNRIPPDVLLLATVLLWSLNFSAVKFGLERGFEPITYAAIRFAGAAMIFTAFTRAHEGALRMHRVDLRLLLILAVVGVWLNQLGFTLSVEFTDSVATVALLFGTLPIFVALIASAFGVERLRSRHWVATTVSFLGVALVAAGSSGGLGGDIGGILMGLVASVTWAVFSVAAGPLMQRYSPYRINAFVLAVGGALLVLTAIPEMIHLDWSDVEAVAWLALLYSMFFSVVVTNVLWFTAIDKVGATRSSLYVNIQPFLGAFFAFLLLSEGLTAIQVVGGVAIAIAIVLARWSGPTLRTVGKTARGEW